MDEYAIVVLDTLLWGALLGLFYTYLGYPLVLSVWGRVGRTPVTRGPVTPAVTIVIAARNEGGRLAARLANCLAQEYPPELLDVVVVSDGSQDETAAVVRAFDRRRVSLVELPEPRGKAVALNAGVAAARGKVIVFADARQRFEPSAVAELVSNFADARVGAVSGELVLESAPDGSGDAGVGLYWRLEKWIRRQEAAIDSTIGTTGAIYAIRRELFDPLPSGTLVDDLLLPMRIAMKGYRVVVEPRARAFDRVEPEFRREFYRKVRTLAGNYQAVRFCPALIDPRRNRLLVQFASHKLCRLAAPFWLALLFLTNLAQLEGGLLVLFLGQVAGYGLAGAGWWMDRIGVRKRWTTAAYTFVQLNLAALVGAWRFVKGGAGGHAMGPWRDPSGDSRGGLKTMTRTQCTLFALSACLWTGAALAQPLDAILDEPAKSKIQEKTSLIVTKDYIIGPEDVLEISVWRNEDLSKVVAVRPDGRISLPLIGDVVAVGKTPTQLQSEIAGRLKEFKENPTVAIMVKEVMSYAIFVLGEVGQSGKYPLKSKTTLLQAITIAGGFTPVAARNKMVVFRFGENGNSTKLRASYDDIVLRDGSHQNVELKPGDTIVVPSETMVLIP